MVFSADDPADAGRRLHYLGHISRAAAALIGEQRAALAELARLDREAKERAARLRAIEQASRAERDKLLSEQRERRRVLERVSADIRKNRKEISVLRADETRLARLIAAIGRSQAGKAAVRRVARQPAPAGAGGTDAALRRSKRSGGDGGKRRVHPRAGGTAGRAVAGGQVVYADWMRGFGNLLIVDHGESYLSIYANNESLLKELGDAVAPGEPIATTGSSGGNEETGLYFEMRHLGRAFDPLSWVKLK